MHVKPYTWNNNKSWKPDAIHYSGLIPEDPATATAIATAIASTTFTSPTTIDAISITGQKLLEQLLWLPLLLQKQPSSKVQSRTSEVL